MDDLHLSEAVGLVEGVQPDGTILIHALRPCVGRGRGRHLYEASMLEQNAHKLTAWKSYTDHLSEAARKALGGLPRSIRDLGGRVIESWWDGSVPPDPDRGFDQGAVVARLRPTPFVRELVDNDPQIVEWSINGDATGVKPHTLSEGEARKYKARAGERVLLVEGIQEKGSLDAVTEAGAGGRVAALLESAYSTERDQEEALLEAMDDDELGEYLREQRPELAEAIGAKKSGSKVEGSKAEEAGESDDEEASEMNRMMEKFMRKGMSRGDAEKAARSALKESNNEGGDEDVAITAETLREALADEEARDVLLDFFRDELGGIVAPLVEAAVAEERDVMRVQTQAHADRQIELRDLRDQAHRQIEEAKLPEKFAEQSKAKFDLIEGDPTTDLDVIPEVGENGEIVKTASAKLAEAVSSEIAEQRELVATIRPTRVTGQGATKTPLREGKGADKEGEGEEPSHLPPLTRALLQEAGFNDPDKVYAKNGDSA